MTLINTTDEDFVHRTYVTWFWLTGV